MARRKRKEDEPDWVPPEFDEVGYMRQEIQGAHAAIATIGWAVIGAVVALLLYAVLPVLAFFAGIAVGFGMYFVFPLIGINTDGFKRRDWVGHGITYFFSWLAFWILLLNPPFSDHTDPTVQSISVSPYHAGYLGNSSHMLSCLPLLGGSVTAPMAGNDSLYVLFRATDNVGLSDVSVEIAPGSQTPFSLKPTPVSGPNRCVDPASTTYPGGSYDVSFFVNATSYTVTIRAIDTGGRQAGTAFQILFA
ncbi:MAG: hypothetical protein E6K08_04720 [Methanobacteriota archaeon]|nr:MAG: hypothetical protein E6K08_04720 [Euryarchaeota archaeon]